jgi:peptidoglycan LD-endopeptidase LytH
MMASPVYDHVPKQSHFNRGAVVFKDLDPAPMFPFPVAEARPLAFADLDADLNDYDAFAAKLDTARGDAPALIGGYGEDRAIYAAGEIFGDVEPRSIHLGVDVWTRAGTGIRAPLDGSVHSFAVNDNFGDYGATIVLAHALPGRAPFCTLYGHLSNDSLDGLRVGTPIARGESFARLGEPHENGGWPPHLHVQAIIDMMDKRGDFPGVAARSEREYWLGMCPDPRDLLV